MLGHLFDTLGRKRMISGTYILSGILLAITAFLFLCVLYFVFKRRVLRPVVRLSDVVNRLAAQDYGVEPPTYEDVDEIGDMAQAIRAQLLRVVQERKDERAGGTERSRVAVRVDGAPLDGLGVGVDAGVHLARGDQSGAGEGGEVLEHFGAAVAEPWGFDGDDLECASEFVDDEGCECFGVDVFGDDQEL